MDSKPIRKAIRRIRKFLQKNSPDPVPDKVHHLRTSTRWLKAAFESFGLDAQSHDRRLLEDLRRIRKKAGKVRDLDVFIRQVLALEARPEEQDCLVELIEHLGSRRARHARKLHAAARKVHSRLRRELKRGWDDLKPAFASGGKAGSAAKKLRAQALAKEVRWAGDLQVPLRLNRGNLHSYRLKVKELHYILRLEGRRNQKQWVKTLGEVKDAIGDWHDREELARIASAVLDHGAQCKLLQDLKAISDDKYKKALKMTLDFRKKYVETAAPRAGKPAVRRADLPAPIRIAV